MAGRLVVVGSGTVVPEGDRGGSAFWAELDASRVLLDCGPGAVQSLARLELPWPELTDLVISHFHGDHVGALPGLFFSLKHGVLPTRREAPLDVWGPPGTRVLFRRLAEALGPYILDPGFPVRLHELRPGGEARLAGGPLLGVQKTPHTEESHAVRLDGAGASVGYTGDTGPEERLGAFLRGVDVLVCECSLLEDEVGDNHLSPTDAARLASAAGPGRLVLTHIYPHVRRHHDVPALVEAAGYEGEVVQAEDGQEHPL